MKATALCARIFVGLILVLTWDVTGFASLSPQDSSVVKWGFIDRSGKIVIPPQFDWAGEFHSGLANVGYAEPGKPMSMNRWAFINRKGKVVIGPKPGYASSFSEGVALVTLNASQRALSMSDSFFIDTHGKEVLWPMYDYVSSYHDGLAAVLKAEGHGISTSGISIDYDDPHAGYMDHRGKIVIRRKYKDTLDFSDGLAAVQDGELWGYIDKSGRMVIPARYQRADPFSEGLAYVELGNKSLYIDKSGRTRLEMRKGVSQYPDFHNGLVMVSGYSEADPNLCGYINRTGHFAIDPQYNDAGPFSDGLARVMMWQFDWFYIDTKGRAVIRPAWGAKHSKDAHNFSEGLAAVAFEVPNPGRSKHR